MHYLAWGTCGYAHRLRTSCYLKMSSIIQVHHPSEDRGRRVGRMCFGCHPGLSLTSRLCSLNTGIRVHCVATGAYPSVGPLTIPLDTPIGTPGLSLLRPSRPLLQLCLCSPLRMFVRGLGTIAQVTITMLPIPQCGEEALLLTCIRPLHPIK